MITDQAKEYLYNRKDGSSSIIVQSKIRNLQQEEIYTRKTIKEKEKEFKQKQEELELQQTELEKMQNGNRRFWMINLQVQVRNQNYTASSFCDLDSVKSEQINDHTENRKKNTIKKS